MKTGAPFAVFASANNKSNQNNWLSIQFVLWKRQDPGRIPQSPQRLCMNKTALRCISGGAQHCRAVREAVSVQPELTGFQRCSRSVFALQPRSQPGPWKKGKKTLETQQRVGLTRPCLQREGGKLESISAARPRCRPGRLLLFKSSRLHSGQQIRDDKRSQAQV